MYKRWMIAGALFALIFWGCSAGNNTERLQSNLVIPSTTATELPSATPSPTITETPAASATATLTLVPSPTLTPTKIGGSGKIVFEGFRNTDNHITNLGIQVMDLEQKQISTVIDESYHLLAVSPGLNASITSLDFFPFGTIVLAEHAGNLYFVSTYLNDPVQFTDDYFGKIEKAYWFPSNKIAFISWVNNSRYLFFTDPRLDEGISVTQQGLRPIHIFPSNGLGCLYFGSGVSNENQTRLESIWCQPFNGSDAKPVDLPLPYFSPVESKAAYFSIDEIHAKLNITIEDMNRAKKTVIKEKLMEKKYSGTDLTWSPDGEQILVSLLICSPAGILQGVCGPLSEYMVFSKSGLFVKKLSLPEQINTPIQRFEWSPDGNTLLFEAALGGGAERHQYLYNLNSDVLIDLHEYFGEGFFFGEYFWLNTDF